MNQDPMIGRQLANFRIERVLGHGGMATVYYGQDIKLQRPVAIKVIDPGHREKTSYIERFIQEARALAGWRHENIIQIYYADDENGLYYFVMEYIDGQNLQEILAEYTSNGELMDFEDVLQIGMAIGSALDYAHQNGVIHRDVKPSNIFIERSGRVMLGDFGLALDIQQGSIGETFGTAHYIAPEQAKRSSDAVAFSHQRSFATYHPAAPPAQASQPQPQ
jgi:serine/threonine protein kinase